jgi:G3E family GTPase
MPAPLIPVTLLTGFLGSGKTTLLNHLVRQPELARTLVIINEFGEIGLDHLLMSRVADGSVVEMSSGCLCCTVRGDLVSTLKDAHWRYSRAGERQFDRVVIETTGLADPAPIIQTLMSVGVITRRYRLDGVVATLDLTTAGQTLDTQPEALKQAAMADCLLLTKADLATPAELAALEQRLDRINPGARRLRVQNGAAPAGALFGLGLFDASGKTPEVARWLNEEALLDGPGSGSDGGHHHHHHHSHDNDNDNDEEHRHLGHHHGDHDHGDPNRHDERIRAFCVVIDEPLAEGMLDAWIDLQLSLSGPDMLRIKGILNLRGRPRPVVIQGVQHIMHPPVELPEWPGDDQRSKLVFITRDIPRETIEASIGAFLDVWRGTPAPSG